MSDGVTELKPCPFCGGQAAFGRTEYGAFVNCVECNSATNHLTENGETESDAAEAWNTRAAPKVKPLVWEREDDGSLTAESMFGLYAAYYDGAYGWLVIRDGHDDEWAKYPSSDDGFDSDKAAQSACNSDYERRILSALEGA